MRRAAAFPLKVPRKPANSSRTLHMGVFFSESPVFAAVNIVEVFLRCDIVGQVITVGLMVFSLVAWTVMFGKHFELKKLRALNHAFESHLRDQRALLDLPESYRSKRSIPYADVFADALEGFLDAGRCPLERLVRGRDAPGELAIDALARDRERVRVRGDRHALEERAV